MYGNIKEHLQAEQTIEENGIFKERIITSPQGAENNFNRRNGIEFCANNYLGYPRIQKWCKQLKML
jgi:7-keto-8-aminopelargonate synthetase-like enzyme